MKIPTCGLDFVKFKKNVNTGPKGSLNKIKWQHQVLNNYWMPDVTSAI